MFFSFIRRCRLACISVQKNVGTDVVTRPLCDLSSDLTPGVAVFGGCRADPRGVSCKEATKPRGTAAHPHYPPGEGVNSWSH